MMKSHVRTEQGGGVPCVVVLIGASWGAELNACASLGVGGNGGV
jgi:hypothetical protein